ETTQDSEDRKPQDRQHQRKLSSKSIGDRAGCCSANESEHQRHGAERSGQRVIDGETALNIDQHKCEDGVVETIEHPAEERGEEGAALLGGKAPCLLNETEGHRCECTGSIQTAGGSQVRSLKCR